MKNDINLEHYIGNRCNEISVITNTTENILRRDKSASFRYIPW